jgi:hypothetical protein
VREGIKADTAGSNPLPHDLLEAGELMSMMDGSY